MNRSVFFLAYIMISSLHFSFIIPENVPSLIYYHRKCCRKAKQIDSGLNVVSKAKK